MPLPSAIFPAALFDGGRVIDNPVDTVTDLSSDADTDRIGGAAINRLKAEMKSVQAQLKTEFQIDFNLKEGNAIVFDADRDTYIQADADDQLGFYVGGAEVVVLDASYMGVGVEFEVFQGIYPLIKADANKNVMLGSPAAHITTDTEGFVYLNTVNGTPTGVPATTHGDSKPIVYDKVNDALYVYNAGWQAVGTGTVAGSGTDNFVPVWTASDTLGNSAYGDDGTYGTFMGIGSSTFNDASTLMKWRGATVPSSFLASSGSGQDLFIRLQDAASGGGGNGASLVITPGAKDGAGTDGKFIVRQPGGVAGTDEAQIYDDGTASVFGTRQSTLQLATSAGVVYNVDIGKIRPASDAASALGIVSVRWTNLFLSGGVCWGTGAAQDLEISRDAASIFRLSTSGVTDALTFCKISGSGSAPASYTAAAGAGIDVHFRAQDAAAGSGQPGGSFYFRPGNRGTTGNRAEFYILDSDGGSQSLSFKCTGGSSGLISYNGANIPIVFSINTTNSFAVTPTFSGSITASEQGSWGFWTKKAFYLSPNSTSQSLGLGAHSTTAFQFFTSATQSDSTTCLLLGANTAPSAYLAAADTDGKHAIFRTQSGGTHIAANPNGGDFRFILGAKGSGGSGTAGTFKIYDSGASGYLNLSHNATDGILTTSTGHLRLQAASDIYLQPAGGDVLVLDTGGTLSLALTHDGTDGVISTSSGDIKLSPITGFVGINKSSPGFPLDVASTATNTARFYTTSDNSNGVSIHIIQDSPSPAANDKVGTFYFLADDSGGTQRVIGRFAMQFDDPTSTSMDSSMIFSTQDAVNAGDFNKNATLTSIGVWTDASAEAFKAWDGHPAAFFGKSVVAGLRELRCEVYHSSSQSPGKRIRERHISPSAEDLWRVFPGLGRDPERLKANGQTPGIAPKDLGGLAICGVVENANEIDALKARVAKLEQEVERLKAA